MADPPPDDDAIDGAEAPARRRSPLEPLTPREEIEHAARAFMWLMRIRDPRPAVPFLAMPADICRLIADRLQLGPGDTVVDIGCGDGQTLKHLMQASGCAGAGLELDPERAAAARGLSAEFEAPLHIVEGDFEAPADLDRLPLERATAVVLFLYPWAVELLLPRLAARLPADARVVSYCFADSRLAAGPREMVDGFAHPGHRVPLYVWTLADIREAGVLDPLTDDPA